MRKATADASDARGEPNDPGRTGSRPAAAAAVLVGRDAEWKLLAAAYERAGTGHAQIVVIEGEPGMGKSALLRAFFDTHGGADLAVRCDEFEAEVAFATVDLLLGETEPVVSEVEAGRRLLARLSDLQNSAPGVTVLAIDDAQWMDRSSAQALRFALRRLRTDRVLAVVARRQHAAASIDIVGEPDVVIRPTPLDGDAVAEMAAELRSWALPPDVAEGLVRRTGGLPLLVGATLAGAADVAQLEARVELSASVATAARRMLASVPPPAQRLVEASAVLAAPSDLVALGDIAEVADPFTVVGAAESAGLLRVGASGTVDCAHDLLRDAVAATLSPHRRRGLNARAARWAVGDRRLAHRAAAADRPDPQLVAELVQAAQTSRAAQRYDLAASQWLRARAVSGDPEDRDRFVLEALVDRVSALNLSAAAELADVAEKLPASALRSLALGQLARESGRVGEARTLLYEAMTRAAAEDDPRLLERARLAAAILLVRIEDGQAAVEAIDDVDSSDDLELAGDARTTKAMGLWYAGDLAAALKLLDEAELSPGGSPWEAELISTRGLMRLMDGRPAAALADLDRTVDLVHLWRPSPNESRTYMMRSMTRFHLGDWDGAAVDDAAAVALAEVSAQAWSLPLAYAVSVDVPAGRGQWDVAADHLAAAKDGLSMLPRDQMAPFVAAHELAIVMARQDFEAAAALLEPLVPAEFMARHAATRPHLVYLPNYIVACLETGRFDEARRALGDYALMIDRWPGGPVPNRWQWLSGLVAERRGDVGVARAHYRDELSSPSLAGFPFLHAQVLQTAGRLELRLGNRAGAGDLVGRAQEIFARLRAVPYRDRCAADLAACGLRPAVASSLSLTSREEDVTTLLARGYTNKEIAADLFVSEKAVEYHLSKIYAKNGVTNRRELRLLRMREWSAGRR